MGQERDNASGTPDGRAGRSLDAQAIELTCERLRVIAEPNRIALLEALNRSGETSVQGLADRIGAPHQKTSKHLAVLYGAGMVSRRRIGPTIRYALIDWTGWWVIEQISRWVQSGLGEEPDEKALPRG